MVGGGRLEPHLHAKENKENKKEEEEEEKEEEEGKWPFHGFHRVISAGKEEENEQSLTASF